jgi:multiple sugar transport system substrate-binding protein
MKNLRFLTTFLVLVAVLLSACAPQATPTTVVPEPTKVPIKEPTIVPTLEPTKEQPVEPTKEPTLETPTFDWKKHAGESITVFSAEQPVTQLLQEMLPEFEELTGIKVDYQVMTEDQHSEKKLIALQAGSDEFDVYQILPSREGPTYTNAGWLEPLDDYIANQLPPDYDFEGIGKGALDGMKFGGKTYCLPINIEGAVLYYRTDLFEQNNIPLPTTAAGIEEAAKALKPLLPEGVYPITVIGAALPMFYDYSPIIHGYYEGYIVDGKPTFDQDAVKESMRLYISLATTYGPPGVVDMSWGQTAALFLSGGAAMMIQAVDQTLYMDDPTQSSVVGKVGLMAMPPGPYGDHPAVISWALGINPNSSKKDAAWYFIAWASGKTTEDKMQLKGLPSPRPSSWEQQAWKDQLTSPLLNQFSAAMSHMIQVGQPNIGPEGVADQPGVRRAMGAVFQKVMLGESTLEEGAAEVNQVILSYMQ